jgi:16S rRNA (cytosine967-C5)-methyltransferase
MANRLTAATPSLHQAHGESIGSLGMNDPGQPARVAALEILSAVLRKHRPLDAALDEILPRANLETRDSGFARAIASETLRRFGQLDALLRAFIAKLPPPHRCGPTLEILLAGSCELLFLDVPAHAAVDAANKLAARDQKAVHFKPLINATLRRIAREGRASLDSKDGERLNMPDWLWARWRETYGEEIVRAIARAHAAQPPLDILRKDSAYAIADAVALPGDVLRLRDAGRVEDIAGFAQGEWWVQDFAATLPARLLGDVRGQSVIDLCAAPGGKTAQLAANGAAVTAVERDPARMVRLKENLARLALPVTFVESDVLDFQPDVPAPFVLLDAPCSATGTIRRHPELPWIKSADDINLCANAAGELLDAAAEMVAPDGTLVFAVCSLEPEEGAEQIARFLNRRADFARVPVAASELFGMSELISPDGDLRTLPCHLSEQGGMDGFYAARLKRL